MVGALFDAKVTRDGGGDHSRAASAKPHTKWQPAARRANRCNPSSIYSPTRRIPLMEVGESNPRPLDGISARAVLDRAAASV